MISVFIHVELIYLLTAIYILTNAFVVTRRFIHSDGELPLQVKHLLGAWEHE